MTEEQLPSRSEIDPQYTWNDTSVFASVEAWAAELAELNEGLAGIRAWQGRLANGPALLADALEAIFSFANRVRKIYVYASLSASVDATDQEAGQRLDRAQGLFGQFNGAAAYLEPELLAIGRQQLDNWLAEEPRLAAFDHYFDNLFRLQAHVRSPEVEELLGLVVGPFMGVWSTFSKLTNSDFQFDPAITQDGRELVLTQSTLFEILNSPDREARRTAWQNYHDQNLAYKNTLASNLATSVKQNVLHMRARRHPSTLEMALHETNIPRDVFDNLITIFRKNLPTWHRYWNVRRRALGLETVHTYDIWAPLLQEPPKIPYKQAVEWIAESLAPLGEEYTAAIRRGCLEQRWVDVYPNQGKSSGAFSTGAQGTFPFIMMSYTDDSLSLGTLAHELGHSMHSFLTWSTQPPVYANYTSFAAEVASNFHQSMLRAYLLDQSLPHDLQIALIEEAMANYQRYFLIMPTLARFELTLHQMVEEGQGLTADGMNKLLAGFFAEAYGQEMVLDRERDGIRWATFPHLYADYYVFEYATGISGANALSRRVLDGGPDEAEDYLNFLKAGGSLYPLDALKMAGVDLSQPEPVEEAFQMLADLIERLDELLNT